MAAPPVASTSPTCEWRMSAVVVRRSLPGGHPLHQGGRGALLA